MSVLKKVNEEYNCTTWYYDPLSHFHFSSLCLGTGSHPQPSNLGHCDTNTEPPSRTYEQQMSPTDEEPYKSIQGQEYYYVFSRVASFAFKWKGNMGPLKRFEKNLRFHKAFSQLGDNWNEVLRMLGDFLDTEEHEQDEEKEEEGEDAFDSDNFCENSGESLRLLLLIWNEKEKRGHVEFCDYA